MTNGQPDGNGHPYVGVAIQPIPDLPGFVTACWGSALSPTVFLTAAHCFDPGAPAQGFVRAGGAPTHQPDQVFTFTRFFAPSSIDTSNNVDSSEFVRLTANPAKGKGGLCFGDSGGPDLIGGTNIVISVNSYVTNGNCSGVTYSNRIDQADILAFIRSFMH